MQSSDKNNIDKRNNKLQISLNSNKDKNNKYRIKPIKKLTKNNRDSNNDENDYLLKSQNQKKNYSESPTIKKSFLITENTNNDYPTKGNSNQYKRNNSSNITNSFQNQHNHLNEESIELIIPTPYPKNVKKIFYILRSNIRICIK